MFSGKTCVWWRADASVICGGGPVIWRKSHCESGLYGGCGGDERCGEGGLIVQSTVQLVLCEKTARADGEREMHVWVITRTAIAFDWLRIRGRHWSETKAEGRAHLFGCKMAALRGF